MYNRYIPQPDGSYRRSRVPEPQKPQPEFCPVPEKEPEQPCDGQTPDCTPEKNPAPPCPPRSCRLRGRGTHRKPVPPKNPCPPRKEPECRESSGNVGNFLKNLLPKDFDTGDLLVVLLLLLMSGDCAEDQNSALLTLVLYLFL